MNKKIFFITLLLFFSLNSTAQKKKSLFGKVLNNAGNTISGAAKKLGNAFTADSLGRDTHVLNNALSDRHLSNPKYMGVSPSDVPLAQTIYDNNPNHLEEYLKQHNIDVNKTVIACQEGEITLLAYALTAGAAHSVKIILDKGANPDKASITKDIDWTYPLQIALLRTPTSPRYTFNFVEDLLKAGADPNLFASVAYAVNKTEGRNLNLLLASEAKIDAKDTEGKSALFYAVEKYNPSVINFLLEQGADIKTVNKEGQSLSFLIQDQLDQLPRKNKTPTIWDPLQVYIKQGLNYISNRQSLLTKLQANGSKFYYTKNPILTPRTMEYFDVSTQQGLHSLEVSKLIANNEADDLKQYLEKNKLSVNMCLGQDNNYPGSTLLDHAILTEAKSVFTMLIDMGADVNKKSIFPNILRKGSKMAKSPLETSFGNPELFYTEKLIDAGANFSEISIIDLVKVGADKSVKKLIALWVAKGANIDAKAPQTGQTAIYYAIDRNSIVQHIAVALVEQGADLTVKDKNGKTPVQYLQAKLNVINRKENSMKIYQYSEQTVLIQKIQDRGFDLYYTTECENPLIIPNISEHRAQEQTGIVD